MTGALAMGSNKVTSSYTPSANIDLTNKLYVDTAVASVGSSYLPLTGGTLTGDLSIIVGKTANFSNGLKVNQTTLSYTGGSFVTTGLPSGVQGGTISGTYRLTALSGQASMAMTLQGLTFGPPAAYTYTFTGLQGSVPLNLQVVQYSTLYIISTLPITASVTTSPQTEIGRAHV